MSTADDRREQARGNGVGQAGQFGHQQHSAPAAFDASPEAAPLAETPTPRVWASATYYNERGTVQGYGDEEQMAPEHTRDILDSWPISALEALRDDEDGEEAGTFAGEYVACGYAKWPIGERCSVGATPDSAELNTYIAARRADEAQRGEETVRAERAKVAVDQASLRLAKQADRYQIQVGATAAFMARQLHPNAKEVLVGTNDMTGEYTLVGVRSTDGTVDTDRVDGDDQLESCLREMPWESPQWIDYIDETGDDADLQEDHGAAYLLNINDVSLSAQARLYELDNA
ncbi:hypothetical protein [Pseudoclavibacter sp. VKM Ac-2888]|uniref:hypothetical protein n=1 Tax=Pseudoclavibacter sp. VKM Ac-2888 TaxID=2783830 RepID=UPI00188B4C60|nr:hypothetical protein [Pseudoclavibacter sp. VKM Ac-2888]MBF4549358.1 hypothetical protein [Pseudoclavibacter sp. VKM Ac-2888]